MKKAISQKRTALYLMITFFEAVRIRVKEFT
jgi:hypothetical protein